MNREEKLIAGITIMAGLGGIMVAAFLLMVFALAIANWFVLMGSVIALGMKAFGVQMVAAYTYQQLLTVFGVSAFLSLVLRTGGFSSRKG